MPPVATDEARPQQAGAHPLALTGTAIGSSGQLIITELLQPPGDEGPRPIVDPGPASPVLPADTPPTVAVTSLIDDPSRQPGA
ncbi:MAG: hypothetical protein AB7G13_19455 [Lautropia sp.]